ncbi:MAG: hypothetical protein ACI9Y1_000267 [Lentisphaeria bacterium]|jgi:hypothetical protein
MTATTETKQTTEIHHKKEKKESLLLNILLNIVVPTVILTKLSGDNYLGVKMGIVVALAFPIGYGIFDFFRVKRINFFSALGVISILLTGGMSLLEIEAKYIAVKEAAIPALFGIATVLSLYTRYPLVKTFLYNDKIIQTNKVNQILDEKGRSSDFAKCLKTASFMVAGSFFLSSALNYGLAKYILVSSPGTEAFNAELGRMTALSYPVIALPAMLILMGTLFYLFNRITRLTELPIEDIFNDPDADHKKQ